MRLLANKGHHASLRGAVAPRARLIRGVRACSSDASIATSSIDAQEELAEASESTSTPTYHTSFIDSQWFKDMQREEQESPSLSQTFRFWHDEKKFKGNGENSLAQRNLLRLGGLRTGGNIKSASSAGPLGWQRKRLWDLIWSPASSSHKCFDGPLRPSAVVSAVPGTQSMTKKKRLSQTLTEAYGEDAWELMPRTFSLPSEANYMMDWMKERAKKATPEVKVGDEMWMLKTAQHLGMGLKLVPLKSAFREMINQFQRSEEAKKAGQLQARRVRPYVSAQQYIRNPLLIDGRKFGLRVWVVIVSNEPSCFSFYLHRNGLVLFSNEKYEDLEDGYASSDVGQVPSFAVTNYAMNRDGQVWAMSQLETHLDSERFGQMEKQMRKILGLAFAASRTHLGAAARKYGHKCSCFELFGVDILIDSSLKPWILEINSTPSLEVSHKDPDTERMIYEQKNGMMEDLFRLIDVPGRFSGHSSQHADRRERWFDLSDIEGS